MSAGGESSRTGSKEGEEGTLLFVEARSPSHLFKMAKRAARAAGISITSVSEQSVMNEEHMYNKQSVFVCDTTESDSTRTLLDAKYKVIGPSVVCCCLKREQALPSLENGFVYCMTMSGIHVSCSNLEHSEREEAYKLVVMMGGEVSKNLTTDVTHLVAGSVGSKKYRTAVKLGIPIMSTGWIKRCWEESQSRIISALDDEFAGMKCPAFKGCCICVTGIENRQHLKQIIEENGGTYSGELIMDRCSHLVAKHPKGMKYDFALKWGLSVVCPLWLYESVKQAVCLDEQLYPVEHEQTEKEYEDERQDTSKSDITSKDQCKYGITEVHSVAAASDIQPNNLQMDVNNLYLDGCKIIIRCDDTSMKDTLCQIVNIGGGTRCSDTSDSVTHLVTDKLDQKDALRSIPYVVSYNWLIVCYERKQRVLEDKYLLTAKSLVPVDNCSVENDALRNDHPMSSVSSLINNESDNIMDGYIQTGITSQQVQSSTGASGPLEGKSFAVADVATGQEDALVRQIVLHGGVMHEASTADILIVSIDSSVLGHHDKQLLRTPFWLSRSIENRQCLDSSLHPLYQPIPIVDNFKPFSGRIFSISQFVDLEADVLFQFIELLGGTVQKEMLRRDTNNLKKTDFLVLREAVGSKYEASKLWNVPAVLPSWIYKCAQSRSLLDMSPFLVQEEQDSKDMPKETLSHEGQQTCKVTNTNGANRKSFGTALALLNETIKPQFETADALKGLNSTDSIGNNSVNDSLLSSAFRDNLKAAVSRLGHSTNNGKAQESNEPIADSSSCLAGVVAFVTKKLTEQQVDLHNVISSLGGDYRYAYDQSCTHVIHEGRLQAGGKEMKLAKQNDNFVVSPHWLFACLNARKRIDEEGFPHTYNPRMSLKGITTERLIEPVKEDECTVSPQKSNQLDQSQTQLPRQSSGECCETDLTSSEQIEIIATAEATQTSASCEDREDYKRQIDELVTVAKSRRSVRGRKSQHRLSISKAERKTTANSSRVMRSSSELCDTGSSSVTWRESMSMATIGYDDPSGREERERIIAQMKETAIEEEKQNKGDCTVRTDRKKYSKVRCLPESQTHTDVAFASLPLSILDLSQHSTEKYKPIPEAPPPIAVPIRPPAKANSPLDCSLLLSQRRTTKHVYVFQLSGLDRHEKMDYSALIESLGGKFYDYDHYVKSTSHLVAAKASRTEKFMAMISAGKWVLHKSYLEASRQAGKFVNEEEHEWGRVVSGKEKPSDLAKAAKRWRVKLDALRHDDPQVGAFSGWQVLLAVDNARKAGFRRLLEAGGATVVAHSPPFNSIQSSTHAFINLKQQSFSTIDINALKSAGILCLVPEYIGEYLVHEGSPNPSRFFITDDHVQQQVSKKRTHTDGSTHNEAKKGRIS